MLRAYPRILRTLRIRHAAQRIYNSLRGAVATYGAGETHHRYFVCDDTL